MKNDAGSSLREFALATHVILTSGARESTLRTNQIYVDAARRRALRLGKALVGEMGFSSPKAAPQDVPQSLETQFLAKFKQNALFSPITVRALQSPL